MNVLFNILPVVKNMNDFVIVRADFKSFFDSVLVDHVYMKYIKESLLKRDDKDLLELYAKKFKYCYAGLVFNKSPHITPSEQNAIDNVIPAVFTGNIDEGKRVVNIFVEFLHNSTSQFFEWNTNKRDFLRNITFKTRQRSIFNNFQENLPSLYWSSL